MLSICMHINIIAVLGTEPRALGMLNNQSSTELYNWLNTEIVVVEFHTCETNYYDLHSKPCSYLK